MLLVRKLLGALVLAVNAGPYFLWGDAGQHIESLEYYLDRCILL